MNRFLMMSVAALLLGSVAVPPAAAVFVPCERPHGPLPDEVCESQEWQLVWGLVVIVLDNALVVYNEVGSRCENSNPDPCALVKAQCEEHVGNCGILP